MVRRRISDDVKELALAMSLQRIPQSEIRELTGVSEHSLKRLRSTHQKMNAVSVKPIATGRPRLLTSVEVKVCHTYLQDKTSSYSSSSTFVIVLSASLTLRFWSYKQCSMRVVELRHRWRQFCDLFNGRATR